MANHPGPLHYLNAGLSGPGARDALNWYDDVREGCELAAAEYGRTVKYVASVVAVLSPRVHVSRNALLARAYLASGSTAGVLGSVRASLENFEATGTIRGPKTRAFAAAILGDSSAVVVDVWVQRALGGVWEAERMEGKRYDRAARVVRSLAGRVGVSPREAQAALWYGVRAARPGDTPATARLRVDRAPL